MLLTRILRNIWTGQAPGPTGFSPSALPKVLCVGGTEQFQIMPAHYLGWQRELLSEQPVPQASIVQDIFQLERLPGSSYDAVFFGHRLKNYALHDAGRVLNGFRHLLKPGGFVHIVVPDIVEVVRHMLENKKDLEDSAYQSPAGPISYHDVLFGRQSPSAGAVSRPFEPHLCGYSSKVLKRVLFDSGFIESQIVQRPEHFEIHAIASQDPIQERFRLIMGLKPQVAESMGPAEQRASS